MLRRWFNGELALGFAIASLLWVGVLSWQAAYSPTEAEKQECQETAKRVDRKTEECKSLWERTTTDPIALYTLGLFLFTAVLGVSTIGLWLKTGEAADAARVAAEHIPRVERAYIFADVLLYETRDAFGLADEGVNICVSNYGKTPGDVERIAFTFCAELPAVPDYDNSDMLIDDRIAPGAENSPTKISRRLRSLYGQNIIYGRVYYRDIFGDLHSSGFVRAIANSQIMALENAPAAFRTYD